MIGYELRGDGSLRLINEGYTVRVKSEEVIRENGM